MKRWVASGLADTVELFVIIRYEDTKVNAHQIYTGLLDLKGLKSQIIMVHHRRKIIWSMITTVTRLVIGTKKWISRNEKALENFEIKTAPDGKKYVYENFKDLIDLDNWQIEGDVLMQEGSDFW